MPTDVTQIPLRDAAMQWVGVLRTIDHDHSVISKDGCLSLALLIEQLVAELTSGPTSAGRDDG